MLTDYLDEFIKDFKDQLEDDQKRWIKMIYQRQTAQSKFVIEASYYPEIWLWDHFAKTLRDEKEHSELKDSDKEICLYQEDDKLYIRSIWYING